jgi:hypothetical protein
MAASQCNVTPCARVPFSGWMGRGWAWLDAGGAAALSSSSANNASATFAAFDDPFAAESS